MYKIVLIAVHATKIVKMRQKSYMCVAMSTCKFEFCRDKILKKTLFPFMLNEDNVQKKFILFLLIFQYIF